MKYISYIFSIMITIGFVGVCLAAVVVNNTVKSLPDYAVLKNYQPEVMSRIHASNGELIAEFATKKRLYLPIQAIPNRVKSAFISAEDKNFYKHFGLDPEGLARAAITDIKYLWIGRRPEGASTITQQVAKNFLLTPDASLKRKIKEAVLAIHMEKAYSKDHILELYLNEIYLGRGAYGIAAAALTYFNKAADELTIAEAAYLAALPKGPRNYDPFKHPDRALARRNWVIDRMAENGYISASQAQQEKAKSLSVHLRDDDNISFADDYFVEEVRKQLLAKYGASTLYGGGLSVRTTLNPNYQLVARKALQQGLIKFDKNKGWRGPYKHIELKSGWQETFAQIPGVNDVPEWQLAVVTKVGSDKAQITLQPHIDLAGKLVDLQKTGTITAKDAKWAYRLLDAKSFAVTHAADLKNVLKIGDVIFVEPINKDSNEFQLCQLPEIQGAMLAMNPTTGRILAMVGGFSFAQSEFNRATQAARQPGSAFKPIVYAAALDNGYTPASVVLDGPVEIDQQDGTVWKPKNYEGGFAGPSTLRFGIEHSRNLMTVRLANDLGMSTVAEYAKRFGVYDNMPPLLSMSLGAGETTLLKMVKAYAIIANKGKSLEPTLIDRIQDRYGKTIYKHDQRICENCNADGWHNQEEPKLIDNREQVLDPMTAYQITSMLEGVVQRGTGHSLKYLNKNIAAKTGTTNDSKDAWFIGFTPNIVVGVYLGYDQPRTLGFGGTGAVLAAPVFGDFFAKALGQEPDVPFEVPAGMLQIPIDPKTGMRVTEDDEDSIIEAFKPGTGPADSYEVIGGTDIFKEGVRVPPLSMQAQDAIENGESGLY
ncbi:MAG: penicillin-binding protein 1A [Alphaproteobacteria bacterium]|nr:penicillin-binding protein 1A [Alphaproteobacteria bacterium]